MRYAICITTVLVWTCSLDAQPTFQKLYRSASSYSFNLIELPSGNILTSMAATHLLDPGGSIEHSSYYHGGGTYLTQTIKAVAPNHFYFTTSTIPAVCQWGDPGNTSLVHPVIGKMDSLGVTMGMRSYELNNGICYGTAGGMEVTSDKGAVIWGRDQNFFALRVDSTLEHVWSKRIMEPGGFQFIKELPDGDLLAGINMNTAGVVVARMDASGNFLWSKSYMRPKGVVHDALIEPDGSFIIVGVTDTINLSMLETLPPTYQPKLFMMKLNSDGEVQWCRSWLSNLFLWYSGGRSRVVKSLDGSYAMLANLGMAQNNFNYHPFLMKTDANGDTLWTRKIGLNGYVYLTQDLLAYSDGGLMMSGIIYGDVPGTGSSLKYIFKSDSSGNFGCYGQPFAVEIMNIFPIDSSFTINAIDGYSMVNVVAVSDSIMDPSLFTTWDACTFTTALPPDLSRPRPRPSVRPNPNMGRFTVQFADPLRAQSYYSVYDAMGRLLFQRPLPAGREQEEVDLSRFGTGTYVIKFTDPEGVCHERVVVE